MGVALVQEFLSRAEFTRYMDNFRIEVKENSDHMRGDMAAIGKKVDGLSREVSELQGRLCTANPKLLDQTSEKGRPELSRELIGVLKNMLILILGGFLALGGATWGQNIIKLLNGGGP